VWGGGVYELGEYMQNSYLSSISACLKSMFIDMSVYPVYLYIKYICLSVMSVVGYFCMLSMFSQVCFSIWCLFV
jgi:hypothetical protein